MEQVVEKAAQYDEDGIEIQFLNNTKKGNVKVSLGRCETPRDVLGLTSVAVRRGGSVAIQGCPPPKVDPAWPPFG